MFPLRTRRALSLYKVYGDSVLVFHRTSLNSDSALLALNLQFFLAMWDQKQRQIKKKRTWIDIWLRQITSIRFVRIWHVGRVDCIGVGQLWNPTFTVFTRWSDCGVEPGKRIRSVFWGCTDPRLHSDHVHGADPATGADRKRARCLHYEISRASYSVATHCVRACVSTCTQSYFLPWSLDRQSLPRMHTSCTLILFP